MLSLNAIFFKKPSLFFKSSRKHFFPFRITVPLWRLAQLVLQFLRFIIQNLYPINYLEPFRFNKLAIIGVTLEHTVHTQITLRVKKGTFGNYGGTTDIN